MSTNTCRSVGPPINCLYHLPMSIIDVINYLINLLNVIGIIDMNPNSRTNLKINHTKISELPPIEDFKRKSLVNELLIYNTQPGTPYSLETLLNNVPQHLYLCFDCDYTKYYYNGISIVEEKYTITCMEYYTSIVHFKTPSNNNNDKFSDPFNIRRNTTRSILY